MGTTSDCILYSWVVFCDLYGGSIAMFICGDNGLYLDKEATEGYFSRPSSSLVPLDDSVHLGLRATARYIDFFPNTLTVWHSIGRYNNLLKPIREGRYLIYRLTNINAFLLAHGKQNYGLFFDPVYSRKRTAVYMRKSVAAIADWDYTKRFDLHPFTIGRSVRYAISRLDAFMDDQLRPY